METPPALPLLRFSCGSCGYGASSRSAPERCPMCGERDSWIEHGWKPFAELDDDLIAAARRERARSVAADADVPLAHEADEAADRSIAPDTSQ